MRTKKYTNPVKLKNMKVEGVDMMDFPDFCDAFISYAEHLNGTPMTDAELWDIPDNVAHDMAMESIS